jgi:prepilin-type N-terminal cleavage/methylation domain-containing protein
MKKTFSSKKSAFSLIELSIVLIIIGLLIAGVTGGASLIKSSELRAAISEARGWSTAVNGFYNQFNAFPGDYNVAIGSTTGAAGNNNSQINAFTTATNPSGVASAANQCLLTTAPTAGCAYEDNVAWVQLKNAGVVDTNIVSNPTTAFINTPAWAVSTNATYGITNPQSKIKSSGWLFDYGTNGSTAGTNQNGQNVVVLAAAVTAPSAANSYVNGSATVAGAITPADALSIDTKVDDGKYNTGRIQGINPGVAYNATTSATTCGVSTALTNYNTAYTTKNCAISYQVDLNS